MPIILKILKINIGVLFLMWGFGVLGSFSSPGGRVLGPKESQSGKNWNTVILVK